MMADLGLNVFQVIQNELIQREGNRSTLGIGYRLAILEEKITNSEAVARNGKIWKPWHAISPVSAQTPESRDECEAARRKLLSRRGADKEKDDKDPTMLPRSEERWEVHADFPRTLMQFKELQFHANITRSLLRFYDIIVYRPDFRVVNTDSGDRCRDVQNNIETCLEELAMHFGLNWQRIGGLALPNHQLPLSPPSSTESVGYPKFSDRGSSPSSGSKHLPRMPHGNH